MKWICIFLVLCVGACECAKADTIMQRISRLERIARARTCNHVQVQRGEVEILGYNKSILFSRENQSEPEIILTYGSEGMIALWRLLPSKHDYHPRHARCAEQQIALFANAAFVVAGGYLNCDDKQGARERDMYFPYNKEKQVISGARYFRHWTMQARAIVAEAEEIVGLCTPGYFR
jgi:hypothetical protein